MVARIPRFVGTMKLLDLINRVSFNEESVVCESLMSDLVMCETENWSDFE